MSSVSAEINSDSVAILILNWNGRDDTIECLNSLKKNSYSNYTIYLLDNASTDDSVATLRKLFHDDEKIFFLTSQINMGFAKGVNFLIEEALKKRPDYLLLLNNDTVVKADFLLRLVETSKKNPQIGMVNPKILFYEKQDVIFFGGGEVIRFFSQPFHIGLHKKDSARYSKEKKMGFATGCCMLIKREVIEKIGLLDEQYFAYFEDLDWSLKARGAGYQLAYAPSSQIWHKSSSSLGYKSPTYYYYSVKNRILFARKNTNLFEFCFLFLPYFISFRYIMTVSNLIYRRKWSHIREINRGLLWNLKNGIE